MATNTEPTSHPTVLTLPTLAPDPSLEHATMLVVDDEAGIRLSLKRNLTLLGYDVLEATDRATALECLREGQVAVVLLDVSLGADNGLELLSEVGKLQPDAQVLIMTGQAELTAAEWALRNGAIAYMRKPFEVFELRTQVVSALLRRDMGIRARQWARDAERRLRQAVPCQLAERLALASRLRDHETGEHVMRMGRYAEVLARAVGMSEDEAALLGVAATTHDVGKIGVPDSILLKPGRLTDEEFRTMQQHTRIGAAILGGTDLPLLKLAESVALNHHERWDGSGYPRGLKGEACPLEARIVAIADVYDALIHERVYKRSWTEREVVEMFEMARDKHFESRLVDAFLAALPTIRQITVDLPEATRVALAG